MAERALRPAKTPALMREKLEQWRMEKQQKTVAKQMVTQNIKTLSNSNGNVVDITRKKVKSHSVSKNPPCSCKAKENAESKSKYSLARLSSRVSQSHNIANIGNLKKPAVSSKSAKITVGNAPKPTTKGNIQRASLSIQAARERRNSKTLNKADQRSQPKKNAKTQVSESSLEIEKGNKRKPTLMAKAKPHENKRLEMRRNHPPPTSYSRQLINMQKPGIKRTTPDQHTKHKNKTPRRTEDDLPARKGALSANFIPAREPMTSQTKEKPAIAAPVVPVHLDEKNPSSYSSYFPVMQSGGLEKNMSPCQVERVENDKQELAMSSGEDMAIAKTPAAVKSYLNKTLSMRERLELWKEEKGIKPRVSYTPWSTKSRKRATPPVVREEPSEEEGQTLEPETLRFADEFASMSCDMANKEVVSEELKEKLRDCYHRVSEDSSLSDDIATELDEIQKSYPGALLCAELWVCKAAIAEHQGDDNRVVCFFEQALVFRAEPEHLIKEAVAKYMAKKKPITQEKGYEPQNECEPALLSEALPDSPQTPEHQEGLKECKDLDELSSLIKYSVTKATPFKSRLQSCDRPVITPVRRSVRLQRRSVHYPTMLQEHGLVVRHLDELPQGDRQHVMFKPNFAVETELNEAWIEMWGKEAF